MSAQKVMKKRGITGDPRREKQGTEIAQGLDNQLLYNRAISQTIFSEILNQEKRRGRMQAN